MGPDALVGATGDEGVEVGITAVLTGVDDDDDDAAVLDAETTVTPMGIRLEETTVLWAGHETTSGAQEVSVNT